MKNRILHFLLLNFSIFLVAAGIHFFKAPNNFATGGVSGLSIIAVHFFPGLNVGIFMFIINTILLIIGLITLDKEFISKTLYSSFALSIFVWILDDLNPISSPLTNDKLLDLSFGILLPAVGSAVIFYLNASTGGTDITAKILSRYVKIDIGTALFFSDFFITLFAGMIFGIQTGLYCILGLILKAGIVDLVIDNIKSKKSVVIISSQSECIKYYIIHYLKRGATVHNAYGAYTSNKEKILTTVLSRRQAITLRNFIRSIDKNAFITITTSSEIIGRGFRSIS